MSLQEKLSDDLKAALRKRDTLRVSTLRFMRAGIQNEEIARRKPLDDPDIVEVLSRQAKQRHDSIDQFREAGRQELVEKEEAELKILLEYLPEQLSPAAIEALAQEAIEAVGARGPADRGKVMGHLMPQLRGHAEGATVNAVVSRLLEDLDQQG